MRFRRVLVLAGGLVLLGGSAGASASTKSATVTLPAGLANGTATATCPHGQRATGGGFFWPVGVGGSATVVESRKIGQRAWRVSGAPGGASVPLTAYVYCSKDAPTTQERSATVSLAVFPAITSSDASCGSSGKARAGGFSTLKVPASNDGLIIDSYRASSKVWRSRAFNDGGGTEMLTSYAYCAKAAAPKARSGSVSSASNSSLVTATSARCKHSTTGAGGFSQPGAALNLAPPFGYFVIPNESLRSGRRWSVAARHFGTNSTTLNSIAYCA